MSLERCDSVLFNCIKFIEFLMVVEKLSCINTTPVVYKCNPSTVSICTVVRLINYVHLINTFYFIIKILCHICCNSVRIFHSN